MCTIAILIEVLADAPVAIAANRDEYYARPSQAPVALAPGVVGGRDQMLGGSWLGFSVDGRFAAVTNQREATTTRARRSRGEWVPGLLLAGDRDAMRRYVDALDPRDYASGNLVFGDATRVDLAYLRHSGDYQRIALPPGITVLANDRLDAAGQPKRAHLAKRLAAATSVAQFRQLAAHALADPAIPDDIPALIDGLPVPAAAWPALHAVCVHTERYGTRNATIAALAGAQMLALDWADGPPCTTAFVDAMPLLSR
jgi:uncharacterized protein with NRDE domain